MPTIFERIESGLSGNDVSTRLSGQASNLGTITSTVTGLIEHPPQGIQDLLSSLSALPLPDIQVGGNLQGTLSSLGDALPTDLSSVTGDLTAKLEQLASTVAGDLVKAVAEGIGPILDLAKLLQLDPTCSAGG